MNNATTRATPKSKRPPYNAKRAFCVKAVAVELEVTEPYVRMAIASDKDMGRYEEIRRSYNQKYAALENAIS